MKNEQMYQEKYADLLSSDADARLVSVIKELDEAAAAITLPPSITKSATQLFKHHYAKQQDLEPKRMRWPLSLQWRAQRLRTTVALLLIITMLTGAASGMYMIMDQVFTMHPSTSPIILEDLGTELNLSQSIDGFTVTIYRVYADANQVVIAYTISGPPGRTFNGFQLFGRYEGVPMVNPKATQPRLTDLQGRTFPSASTSWGSGSRGGVSAYLLRYDIPVDIGAPQELNLRLEARAIEVREVIDSATSVANPESCFNSSLQQSPICTFLVRGSFFFSFTVPLE